MPGFDQKNAETIDEHFTMFVSFPMYIDSFYMHESFYP